MNNSKRSDDPLRSPLSVSKDVWYQLEPDIQQKINECDQLSDTPIGIEDTLWEKLDDEVKLSVIQSVSKITEFKASCTCVSPKSSNIYHFFFGAITDLDLDTCVNSMALISALVLTIPYSVIGNLGPSFWQNFREAVIACDDDVSAWYEVPRDLILNNLYCSLVSSVCGIILSTFYYLFKPATKNLMTVLTMRKLKYLVFVLFMTCIIAIVSIMNLAVMLSWTYTVDYTDQWCRPQPSLRDNGRGTYTIRFTILGLIVAAILVW